ncbi:serine protease [Thalassospira sp. GO-4]|jgi:S1-C subfamily serine protease|uniref:trypsin-like peptidase domain-containing protein n=1 Tax=Thalassospira sp. GO-4 TaxID=2946605 RepID=UPI00202534C9|nr:trypsin-like peptidase domain-containing protein [Thalassospira sp. GO-4]URK19089.1 serine protease [Thalassospira sp. GO-4]
MGLSDVVERVRSGVLSISFLDAKDRVIAKGTGFMCNGFLVTNNHVFQGPDGSKVWIRNCFDSEVDLTQGHLLSIEDFRSALVVGSPEENYDYAILEIAALKNRSLYNFSLVDPKYLRVGDSVALLGFPLEHMNLTCHAGIASSFYTRNGVDIIQVDASVNASNSGGPMIAKDTGEVLGIVTRKATGLTNMFNQLRQNLKTNIDLVYRARQSGGLVFINGVDPLEAVGVSQGQMMELLGEIERSANVGIGYVFSAKHLLEEPILTGEP